MAANWNVLVIFNLNITMALVQMLTIKFICASTLIRPPITRSVVWPVAQLATTPKSLKVMLIMVMEISDQAKVSQRFLVYIESMFLDAILAIGNYGTHWHKQAEVFRVNTGRWNSIGDYPYGTVHELLNFVFLLPYRIKHTNQRKRTRTHAWHQFFIKKAHFILLGFMIQVLTKNNRKT